MFMMSINKCLIPPKAILISHKARFGNLQSRIIDLVNNDPKLNFNIQCFINYDEKRKL